MVVLNLTLFMLVLIILVKCSYILNCFTFKHVYVNICTTDSTNAVPRSLSQPYSQYINTYKYNRY